MLSPVAYGVVWATERCKYSRLVLNRPSQGGDLVERVIVVGLDVVVVVVVLVVLVVVVVFVVVLVVAESSPGEMRNTCSPLVSIGQQIFSPCTV